MGTELTSTGALQTYMGQACAQPAIPAATAALVPPGFFAGNYTLESAGTRDMDNYPLTQNVTVVTGNDASVSIFQVSSHLHLLQVHAVLRCTPS